MIATPSPVATPCAASLRASALVRLFTSAKVSWPASSMIAGSLG
jgi:hypothetical protein